MKKVVRILLDLLLLIIACCALVPFIYMVITSLKVTYSAFDFGIKLNEITLQNYKNIFTQTAFLKYFINTTIIAFSGVVINLVFSSLAGYAFAKLKFKGNDKLFLFMIMTLIIPSQVTMIPLYIIMRKLNWINTFWALILPITTAFGVFLMRQSILGIPKELIEAAKLDGCTDLRIFLEIILPLIKPAILTLAIFTFIGAWNEFLWPLIISSDDSVRTLTVGMSTLKAQYTPSYGLNMAAATLTFLPPFLFYLILQNKFIEGVTATGIKG